MHRKAIIADRLISNMKPKRQSTIKRTIILKSIELRQSENSLKMINYEEN